jgi:hypothetical protein
MVRIAATGRWPAAPFAALGGAKFVEQRFVDGCIVGMSGGPGIWWDRFAMLVMVQAPNWVTR